MSGAVPFTQAVAGSQHLHAAERQWTPSDAPGFEIVTLFENRATGELTQLMRVAPGAYAGPHSHDRLEEILVLDGTFADDACEYRQGSYCIRAPGAVHTARSATGCVVLLVYRGAPQESAS
ncbi:cupin domain-containing protein [Burkholderia sp. Ac-20379]|uniref:cupin domain-containing protein n=1 Tax=Burkholderia sp. Ac-20379 TaxID=2703900 RepID=UPI00197EC89D|nr:cupin domain-containing protein [Burkholderia sp. Ac-20379]MBN3723891.1 anti-Sigm factor, ChrR [Burkholderia sp. Ac-20379]